MLHNSSITALLVVISASVALFACSSSTSEIEPLTNSTELTETPLIEVPERYTIKQPLDFTINLTTTAVGGRYNRLDRKHSCEQGNMSPPLKWDGVPETAKSLVFLVEDPSSDVYGLTVDILWTHWIIYSIAPNVVTFAPDQAAGDFLENGAKQGTNDYGYIQYDGPCPVPTLKRTGIEWNPGTLTNTGNINAESRPYYFKIYALDKLVDLEPGVDRDTLLKTIDGHILAAGELPINYKSRKSASCQTPDTNICVQKTVDIHRTKIVGTWAR